MLEFLFNKIAGPEGLNLKFYRTPPVAASVARIIFEHLLKDLRERFLKLSCPSKSSQDKRSSSKNSYEEQPTRCVPKKRCSENSQKKYRRTTTLKCKPSFPSVLSCKSAAYFQHLGTPLSSCFCSYKKRLNFLRLILFVELNLRILTEKKHPEIKLQRLRKIRILTFGSLVHQINSF